MLSLSPSLFSLCHSFLGSYFRVGFYGLIFGDLDRQEFIYKEAALTRLAEFSLRMEVRYVCYYIIPVIETLCIELPITSLLILCQNLYGEKLGTDKIELLKESKMIDPSTLDPAKVQNTIMLLVAVHVVVLMVLNVLCVIYLYVECNILVVVLDACNGSLCTVCAGIYPGDVCGAVFRGVGAEGEAVSV